MDFPRTENTDLLRR